MDHNGEEIGRLVSDIDADMVRNRTSFVLCRYSGEAFNTASFIAPNAADMFSYPPILAGFGITTIVVAGSLFGSKRLLRKRVANQS